MRRLLEKCRATLTAESARPYVATSLAVGVAAVAGAIAVKPKDPWFRGLDKPSWQPPGGAFGAAWTPLFVCIAIAGGRALSRTQGAPRKELATGLGVNLVLNAAWNWMFFRLRNPVVGLAGTLALDASNAHLIRVTARADRTAVALLVPYAAWCAFATALNAELVRRNPQEGRRIGK